ncbi:hypothetical protein C8R41DRAFT_922912 [Lentinula lateritia]|uniref:Uncharacterized protein n=1 Tax=Lentinula lateritia TaxID=40482 RepID=A0ABQ8VBK4_9AGAR|nr:hypothetical protein C8R41DRAFT_922912 [Lentinula lateritia]
MSCPDPNPTNPNTSPHVLTFLILFAPPQNTREAIRTSPRQYNHPPENVLTTIPTRLRDLYLGNDEAASYVKLRTASPLHPPTLEDVHPRSQSPGTYPPGEYNSYHAILLGSVPPLSLPTPSGPLRILQGPPPGSHLSVLSTTRSFLSSVAVPVAPFELQPAPSTLQRKLPYTKTYPKTYSDPGLTGRPSTVKREGGGQPIGERLAILESQMAQLLADNRQLREGQLKDNNYNRHFNRKLDWLMMDAARRRTSPPEMPEPGPSRLPKKRRRVMDSEKEEEDRRIGEDEDGEGDEEKEEEEGGEPVPKKARSEKGKEREE